MKKIIFLIFLAPTIAGAQSIKQIRVMADTMTFPCPLKFSFVDSTGNSKSFLYSKCMEYVAMNVSSLNIGMQMHDSTSGTIVIPNMTSNYNSDYRYTLAIDVREGKYRLRIEDFEYETSEIKKSLDSMASMKNIFMSIAASHRFWQGEKYMEREEANTIFENLKAFVGKKDSF